MSFYSIPLEILNSWADFDPRRAQELLPELVQKLILASAKDISEIHIAYGSAVQYCGFDGYTCINDEDSPFFANGETVWEFGTNEDIKTKFLEDYEKRTTNSNGIVKNTTTYIFVTTRIWNHKVGLIEFEKSINDASDWKAVRIIDATTLAVWIDSCPPVAIWLSEKMGRRCDGLISIEDYWENITRNTKPSLNIDFFLVGRDPILPKVVTLLNNGSRSVILCAETQQEALITFSAEMCSSTDLTYEEIRSRCIIVKSEDAWHQVSLFKDCVLIPLFVPKEIIKDNTIIYLASNYNPINLFNRLSEEKIEIQQRSNRTFCAALEKLGYDSISASDLNKEVKRSFNALLRIISTDPQMKVPSWATEKNMDVLLPAVMIGSWDEHQTGDQKIVELLSGKKYDDYAREIRRYYGDDKPVIEIDGHYTCVSIPEIWNALYLYLNSTNLNKLKEATEEVFSETDPTYELDEEKWMYANIFGKHSIFSYELKTGLIISLIMISERDRGVAHNPGNIDLAEFCNVVVRNVLNNVTNLDQWRTIVQFIPDFVEAAPDEVLNKIETNIDIQESAFWGLFNDPVDPIFGKHFYPYLLFAIEKLIWIPEYVCRSINLLLKMSTHENQHKISNSPINTLIEIFCLWYPQGALTEVQRGELWQIISKEYKETSREMIKELLSTNQTISTLSKYRYRKNDTENIPRKRADVLREKKALAERYLAHIEPCFSDWEIIFEDIDSFLPIFDETIEVLVQQLESFSINDRIHLCKTLGLTISKHRKFANSKWHIAEEFVCKLEKLYYSVFPETPLAYSHYFSYSFDGFNPIVYKGDGYNMEAAEDYMIKFQTEKIQQMMQKHGEDSLFDIMPYLEKDWIFARIVFEMVLKKDFPWDFIKKTRDKNLRIARLLVKYFYEAYGIEKLCDILQTIDKKDQGWVLTCLRIDSDLVMYVDNQDETIQSLFWSEVDLFSLDSLNHELAVHCIRQLLAQDRPYTLINELAFSKFKDNKIVIEILRRAIEFFPQAESKGLSLTQIPAEYLEEMFEKLYENTENWQYEIAQLEIAYLSAFNDAFEPQCLVSEVLLHPNLFIELLAAACTPDEDSGKSNQNSPEVRRAAYNALKKIRRIPGSQKNGIDEPCFTNWVKETKQLAISANYTRAYEVHLGRILSYAPDDNDGVWPIKCVREYFEVFHSETLVNSFIIGLVNQRGMHNVTDGEGEEALAAKYNGFADILQWQYPHSSAIIKKISKHYLNESSEEKKRALRSF